MRKVSSVVLICLLTVSSGAFAAETPRKGGSLKTGAGERVKAALDQMEAGGETRVTVTLKDKSVVVGYLHEVATHSFFVTDPATGTYVQVPYRNVTHLAALSNRAKLTLTVVVIGAAIAVYLLCYGAGGCGGVS